RKETGVTTVGQILNRKGHEVLSISPTASVYEAIRKMAQHQVGALVVLERGTLSGIISERDYARKVILQGRRSRETAVREVMTREVVTVRPEQSTFYCMEVMTEGRVRHLPVLDEGRLVGIISIGDVVKSIISQQEFMIEELERYISGRVGPDPS
ncbi:MAG TPA: CBS domain-containing protein, partial [Trueperaceae bacterium]